MTKSISSLFQPFSASRFGRLFATAACAALLTSVASANVNGKYKYRSAKGSFAIAGQKVKIGKQDLKGIVAKRGGKVVVKNNKITLFPNEAGDILDKGFSGPNYNIKVRASGPKAIPLKKKGSSYTGKTKKPLLVRMTGNAAGQSLSGKVEYNLSAKVKGKKMKLNIDVKGDTQVAGFGQPITGKIIVLAKR